MRLYIISGQSITYLRGRAIWVDAKGATKACVVKALTACISKDALPDTGRPDIITGQNSCARTVCLWETINFAGDEEGCQHGVGGPYGYVQPKSKYITTSWGDDHNAC